jgi:arylsulfatase A-like enzyme
MKVFMKHIILFILLLGILVSCSSNSTESGDPTHSADSTVLDTQETPKDSTDADINGTPTNILFIIADDMGKDATNGYTEGTIKPKTPNLDSIRLQGLRFDNFWSYPTCTPTRSSAITGKYGYRTGIKGVGISLPMSETILQKHISQETDGKYATAIVGKWHLSGNGAGVNPEDFGLDYYAGLISGAVVDYYQWTLNKRGTTETQTSYITEKLTDLAIDWVEEQTKPWFLWLAYNTPHTPFHAPPSNMHSQGNLTSYVDSLDPMPYYMAAIEAMDFQIGRFLQSLSQEERNNTLILFIGDNGSPNQVAQNPYTRRSSKNSLKQGGINVPLFASGKGVSRTGVETN